MTYHRRVLIFALIGFLLILFDWIKFLMIGEPNIVNWHSFVHPAWVFFGFGSLLLAWFFRSKVLWRGFFWLFFAVFIAALLNQYLSFSEILTYNCMLFNAIFVAIYFVGEAVQASH